MERIARQHDTGRELANRVLSWIIHAYRSLSLKELQHAVAVHPGMTVMDSKALDDELILTSVCAGLVVVDEHSSVVHLARKSLVLLGAASFSSDYTAQEYFESKQSSIFPNANIATMCLAYLSSDMFGRDRRRDSKQESATSLCSFTLGSICTRRIREDHQGSVEFSSNVTCAGQMLLAGEVWGLFGVDVEAVASVS